MADACPNGIHVFVFGRLVLNFLFFVIDVYSIIYFAPLWDFIFANDDEQNKTPVSELLMDAHVNIALCCSDIC